MSKKAAIKQKQTLSNSHYYLQKVTFDYLKDDGNWQTKSQEVYDVGNAATVLLYNKEQGTVILTRQFRIPTFLNGNESGMLIETCAGKLDKDSPETAIKREIEEETGYKVTTVQKVMEAYSSPGALSELLHYFIAEYTANMKAGAGGGLQQEKEEVQVLELPFDTTIDMMRNGVIKDAKTIILLQYAQLHQLL